jgi:GDPmannose 4,6-dehydratase
MANNRTALITGITGQDGSYLAELLLEKGYVITGVTRGEDNRENIAHIENRLTLIQGDIGDADFVGELVSKNFDEIYNLASIATVAEPLKDIPEIERITAGAPVHFLESVSAHAPKTKFFQASSAEMYGAVAESPQSETTPFIPANPYGEAKLKAHRAVEEYRGKGVFAVSGILFNHESPRRPESFVTRKITTTLARIAKGGDEVLRLGNLDAKRDWSYAGDIVRGMWMSLQAERPDSYVFASGESHTVREFVDTAAGAFDLNIAWEGAGEHEIGRVASGRVIVSVDPAFFRPVESHIRLGNISKAKKNLGWEPEVSFSELVRMMVKADKAIV